MVLSGQKPDVGWRNAVVPYFSQHLGKNLEIVSWQHRIPSGKQVRRVFRDVDTFIM